MENLNETIVRSLDGRDVALLPFLPELLQDLWEIGSSAETMLALMKKHGLHQSPPPLKILDLGCGKGAISIPIARALGATVVGMDAVPEFIAVARQKASEWQVASLCSFQVGDIRTAVHSFTGFNVIFLGSIGPVLGNVAETLKILKNCLLPGGYLLLDDGYIPDESSFTHPCCQRKREYLAQIYASDFTLRDEWVAEHESISAADAAIYRKIETQVQELSQKYPEKRTLFEAYLQQQREENYVLEHEIHCSLFLLQLKE
ncbi:class I SAM-dependent methyltransferase [candidate division KSB1 bacterium]|nr:class I SAM-dependent methyltransferase [candidate division KSB1 bacterium]